MKKPQFKNKTIPENLENEIKKALSHYPELSDTPIVFRYKSGIKRSFMQAQPQIANLFFGKKNRGYNIFISEKFNLEGQKITITDVPHPVLVGWFGHELGHIMDYKDKSAFGLIIFGFRYLTSKSFIKKAERIADTFAVHYGMSQYIIKTKEFILNHSHLSETYKNRIRRLYLSTEEILVLVNSMEKEIAGMEKEES